MIATLAMMALSAARRQVNQSLVDMAFAALERPRWPLRVRRLATCCCLRCRRSGGLGSSCNVARRRGSLWCDPRRRHFGYTAFPVTDERVLIRRAGLTDEAEFLAAVDRSRRLHQPWVRPPNTPDAYRDYLAKHQEPHGITFFIWLEASRGLVGVVNVGEIVHGSFRSAYLGYYAFVPFAGRGLMKEGLGQVVAHAFQVTKLHRLEANIQPANHVVESADKETGFRREGLSPRYLKINGRWRDHERWAILSEDW